MSVGRAFRIGDINVITANLSAYRTDYKGRKDDSISLSLSVPIGDNTWKGMDIQTNNGKTSPMVSYTDTAMNNCGATSNTARVMVDTNGIGGVQLYNEKSRTNRFVIAVVSDVVSYNSFDTRVDVDAMDSDIEPVRAISTTTLTIGAMPLFFALYLALALSLRIKSMRLL